MGLLLSAHDSTVAFLSQWCSFQGEGQQRKLIDVSGVEDMSPAVEKPLVRTGYQSTVAHYAERLVACIIHDGSCESAQSLRKIGDRSRKAPRRAYVVG